MKGGGGAGPAMAVVPDGPQGPGGRRGRRRMWLPKETNWKSVSQSIFRGTSTYFVLDTLPPLEDDHGKSDSSHVKYFLLKELLECLLKCSSLLNERHCWNTDERS